MVAVVLVPCAMTVHAAVVVHRATRYLTAPSLGVQPRTQVVPLQLSVGAPGVVGATPLFISSVDAAEGAEVPNAVLEHATVSDTR